MKTYATQSNYWRESFNSMADSWKKLKTSNLDEVSSGLARSSLLRYRVLAEVLNRELFVCVNALRPKDATQCICCVSNYM